MRRTAIALFLVLLFASRLFAQTGNASLTGYIQDSSKAFISGVRVLAINTATNQQFATTSDKDGSYYIASLPVGPYRMQIEKEGFQTILKEDLFLHTQDVLQINFQMTAGSISESVTVEADSNNINTTNATVGMTVDREFVQNMPLNGRSFENLILQSPGVVTASPQGTDSSGEFSVNGQRTDSNNFILDGVSASNMPGDYSDPGSAGSASNATALGTTQSMISLDAMQEFTILTNTYPAEFGRQPGAQVSITSRSGTNEFHGTAFDYLRNYAFDANNWFNTYSTPALARPAERQNDFGGVLGGPLSIPRLFSGKDRAFFFFSYEGLRLTQPTAPAINYVPSNGTLNTATNYAKPEYENLRATTTAIQPALNGFPLPNCATVPFPNAIVSPQCVDYGDGLLPFLTSTTLPSSIDSLGARIDWQALPSTRIFARYSDAESSSGLIYYGLAPFAETTRNRLYLLGVDSAITSSIANQLRLQYSPAYFYFNSTGQSYGGVTSVVGPQGPNLHTMEGIAPVGGKTQVELGFAAHTQILIDDDAGALQFQPNAVDTVTWSHGRHVFKTGVDYRQTTSYLDDSRLSLCPEVFYDFSSASAVWNNQLSSLTLRAGQRQDPTYKQLGLYVQDEWRIRPRVSLSLGLRWDLNPPPTISGAQQYTYTGDINNPSSLALSRLGAPLYQTTWTDFGPRVGVAVTIRNTPGYELILRAGGGLYYDTGQDINIGEIGDGLGLGAANTFTRSTSSNPTAGAFPLAASTITAPPPNPPAAPYTMTYVTAPNLVPPSTVQWSASLEQAIGPRQTFTMGYVGTEGRNLSSLREYSLATLTNHLFSAIEQYENGASSNYNALQLQYKRQAARGLQALASYTWSHAIDDVSEDYNNATTAYYQPYKGNSDSDVRHNFTTALIYAVPTQYEERWQREILGHWSLDLTLLLRTGFPFQPDGPVKLDPLTGSESPTVLDYNGQNPYLYKAGIPGGRQVNPAVFSVPASTELNGNAPRNFLRGFGEKQADLAIQRTFPLREQVRLQFRGEAFNLPNHPNFGAMNTTCGNSTAGQVCSNPLMGQATGTLSNSAITNLSSIYQSGGPRSMQFMLKLEF